MDQQVISQAQVNALKSRYKTKADLYTYFDVVGKSHHCSSLSEDRYLPEYHRCPHYFLQ